MEEKLEFAMLGISELSKDEAQQTNGGWIRIFYTYLIALAKEAVTEGLDKCFKDLSDGFEEVYKN